MKNTHTVIFHREQGVYERLCELGFAVEPTWLLVKIDEDDSRWPEIAAMIVRYSVLDQCHSTFSPEECREATWLDLVPSWHCGYPMPDDDFGYLQQTYNLERYCPHCGVGKCQKAPFRLRSEPNWGTKKIMQVNWIFDEFFVTPDAWKEVFQPNGIECYPVIHHRSGKELATVVQLRIDAVLQEPLNMEGYRFQTCPECHAKKYYPISCGFFPTMKQAPEGIEAVKSIEYFGDGPSANRTVFISNKIYVQMQEYRVRGASYKPVGEVNNHPDR